MQKMLEVSRDLSKNLRFVKVFDTRSNFFIVFVLREFVTSQMKYFKSNVQFMLGQIIIN